MNAKEIRESFFDFFSSKNHIIVPSAPITIKNDPTLMFTNAGMNQFKDIFLGNKKTDHKRVADSQKCLRVSGKHNDLEEVGRDTYHHTMFEMLGNWSFGDYFKKEAIGWGWEYLTETLGIDRERLYATIFKGDESDNLERDNEAYDIWAEIMPPNRIIEGSKKDNFWEMGETGPCGPCSEIHIDLRDDDERRQIDGRELVNKDHPLVIEIWNLVFMQYNRKANGTLELLPNKHVDTGMGFERLCMVVQGKKSNYDTDIFQTIIGRISDLTGKQYGINAKYDIAMRVIADHLRAVAFSIADGQLPSNNKAGYVIRRILRRAVRYAYTNLGVEEPLMFKLVSVLDETMGDQYPEIRKSKSYIEKIIVEEENTFLKTLGRGLKMINSMIQNLKTDGNRIFPGKTAFELYDTFGFPVDLTQLILRENNMELDMKAFEEEMRGQKNRSRSDASHDTGDWIILKDTKGTVFTGYNNIEDEVFITKYRTVRTKGKDLFQLVFDKTPFYAEMGGQVGDTGIISSEKETINILNTIKENELTVHLADRIPASPEMKFTAKINTEKRLMTANNHTATHILHYALRKVLGKHVEQKGSYVSPDRLRFDFSHFSKPSKEEMHEIEKTANAFVRQDFNAEISTDVPIAKAREMGAMALFGEKYGNTVRVVKFGDSIELCGGTHVNSTASIGLIKIISESAISTGVRRIEAITAGKADEYVIEKIDTLNNIGVLLKSSGNIVESVERMLDENNTLKKQIAKDRSDIAHNLLKEIESKAIDINGITFLSGNIEAESADTLKSMAMEARKTLTNSILILGADIHDKANIAVMVNDDLIQTKKISAINIIKEIAPEIRGGGGGQPFIATAGGKNVNGIDSAIKKAAEYIRSV